MSGFRSGAVTHEGQWKASVVDQIFPLLQPHPLRFSCFNPGCFFMIRTINAFVTVVNVSLTVCSALTHTHSDARISKAQGDEQTSKIPQSFRI